MSQLVRSSDVLVQKLRDCLPAYASQREMAERIGIHEGTLSRWLSRDPKRRQVPNPTLSEMESIAAELGVSVAELVSASIPPSVNKPLPQGTPLTTAEVRVFRAKLKELDAMVERASTRKR